MSADSCPRCGLPHPRCTAHNNAGEPCGKHPVKGGEVCATHGLAKGTPGRKAADRKVAMERAVRRVATYGMPVNVDPATALLEEIYRTAGHVAWLQQVVGDLGHDGDGVTVTTNADGEKVLVPRSGLKQLDASGKFEKPSVWVELYLQERKHLAVVAKAALDAGVAQQLVDIAQSQAERIGRLVDGVVRALGHDPADPAVREAVRAQLHLVRPA